MSDEQRQPGDPIVAVVGRTDVGCRPSMNQDSLGNLVQESW